MIEREWLDCADPDILLDHLGYRLTERQSYRFAVACCRRIWHRFTDERAQRLVEVADRIARGQATRKDRLAAEVDAFYLRSGTTSGSVTLWQGASPPVEQSHPNLAAALAVGAQPALACRYAHDPNQSLASERAAQAAILRDIVIWPGRVVQLRQEWLTPTVRDLVRAVDLDDDFGRLPILGDALEDAGCDNEHLLNHCREAQREHVPGCWLVRELIEGCV